MLTGFVLYPLWHRSGYGPSVWPLGIARGWAHVFAIWDGARGKSMSWHPDPDAGKLAAAIPDRGHLVERRHGRCCGWLLAIWRTATLGSLQFAVLLFFGAAQPRRRRPGHLPREAGSMRYRLVTLIWPS